MIFMAFTIRMLIDRPALQVTSLKIQAQGNLPYQSLGVTLPLESNTAISRWSHRTEQAKYLTQVLACEWARESLMLKCLATSRDRQCQVTAPYSMKCLPVQISPWSGLRKKLISYWHSSWNCEALLGQQCVTQGWNFISTHMVMEHRPSDKTLCPRSSRNSMNAACSSLCSFSGYRAASTNLYFPQKIFESS